MAEDDVSPEDDGSENGPEGDNAETEKAGSADSEQSNESAVDSEQGAVTE